MSIIVREDLSVPISSEMAESLGLHPGSSVQWERTPEGNYVLLPALSREEAARQLHRMLAHTLKPGESAVADLLREREEDAAREERV